MAHALFPSAARSAGTARAVAALTVGLALAGCSATGAEVARPATLPVAPPVAGLERVIGQNAAGLARLFGLPDADIREGSARKLQYQGAICVLDAYLYPRPIGDAVVTYVDARQPDGSTIDRASCVAALSRRGVGK
ncbi:hypothetical protein [uncultured Sphingomonas sp.]|uniref:hypothetical protein n=1 Tax=uncultured Sphingomonas sp. TaxID=158754 RepID=UPI0035CABF53